MKKTLTYNLIIINILLFLGGCSDDFDMSGTLEPSLSVHYLNPSRVNFDHNTSAAFTENFKVESYETPWKFSGVADWFSLNPMTGDATSNISLDVRENNDATNARSAIFYLESTAEDWNYNRALSVSQQKATPNLSIEKTTLSFGGATEIQSIKVTGNCPWTASCSDSWVDVSADAASGTLKVSVESNPLSTYRSSTIYVRYGDNKTITISISQAPANITVSDHVIQFENVASRANISIESETPWTATVSDSWITVNPDKGDAGKTIASIEVTPNTSVSQRMGSVLIRTGNSERIQISIVQRGLYIEAEQSSITFGSKIESKTLSIKSNTSWSVISKPNWISISKDHGEGNENITLTSEDNPNTTPRSGEIVIDQQGLTVQARVEIIQEGKSLSADVQLLEFSDKASKMNFNLTADTPWTSTNSATWFNSTPTTGNGNATVTVSVEENTAVVERTGIIQYKYLDKSANVNVHQLAKYLTIDNKSFQFDSKGGSHTIEVLTNDEWTAEIEHNVSWLKLSKSSGTGVALITLTADDNPSVNVRSTSIVIKSKYSQSVRILVSQQPRNLSVSSESILFFASGGTSEVVKINTNGKYNIKTDVSWFTINKGADNTFTVYAPQNYSNEMRRGRITISLTDLKEGSLSLELWVVQAGEGGSFILTDFTDDKDWNNVGNGSLSVTITGFTTDRNWNDNFGGTLTVTVTGYSSDKDWNKDDKTNGSVTLNLYGTDQDWNASSTYSGNPSKSNYKRNNK